MGGRGWHRFLDRFTSGRYADRSGTLERRDAGQRKRIQAAREEHDPRREAPAGEQRRLAAEAGDGRGDQIALQGLPAEHAAREEVDDDGQILLGEYEKLLGPKTRIVAFTQVSNALGTVTPVAEMTALAHRHGAKVLVDGAQGVCHMPVDVQALDVDFYVFSGHKMFAPTGIGVLYGKADVLEAMAFRRLGSSPIAADMPSTHTEPHSALLLSLRTQLTNALSDCRYASSCGRVIGRT